MSAIKAEALVSFRYKDVPTFKVQFNGLECLAKVVKVYDGDTVTLVWHSEKYDTFIKKSCRLGNYNTAEIKGGTETTRATAIEARDYLTSLICDCDNSDVMTCNKKLVKVQFYINEPAYQRPLICLYDENEENLTFKNSINQKIMDKFNLPVYNPSNVKFK